MSAFDWRSPLLPPSVLLLACSLFIAVFTDAQDLPRSYSQPRIAAAIDESSRVTLRGNTHPLAQPRFDQGPVPVSMPAGRLLLVLARSTQQEAGLQTWLQSVQDVNSPNYRKFLSPEDFGKRFGVGDADLQSIQAWLAARGFTVNKVSKGRMAVEFSGSVGQVQSAFHTSLHSYVVNGEQHWANASDPQIPSALAPVVAGFASLNNFKPRAQYVQGPGGVFDPQTHTIRPAYTNTDSYGDYYIYLGPADAATIYNTPTTLNANFSGTALDGTGVTIGVAGDSNIDVTQNANYRSTFGLAPNPVTVVVDGDDPGENPDSIEAYLDTQVSSGIAPNAKVILYTAASNSLQQGLYLAIQRAIDDNQADILNVSFGECEAALGASGNQYILNLWEQAAAQGISVTVSSGDSGSAGCDADTEAGANQGLAVNGLGSTPYNISVGGTDFDILYSNFPSSFTTYVDVTNTLPKHRSALGYIPEEPWNDSAYPNSHVATNTPILVQSLSSLEDTDIIAAGGGISSVYPVPAWQAAVATGAGRNLPDVSFLAGNGFYGALWSICTDQVPTGYADCAAGATGNNFYLTGIGGTSASAPAFAGILALVKQKTGTRIGQADFAIYDLAGTKYSTVFHDVAFGDNSVVCIPRSSACSENSTSNYFMTGYDAVPGYDLASGLGSVDASQLVANWPGASFIATSSSLQLNGATAPLNIAHGQSVAVNASVTSAGGMPSGIIALVDNLTPAIQPNSEGIAEFALTSGSASGTTNSLPGGTYQVSAHYGGSGMFAQSDSNAISVTVGAESSTTSLKVTGFYDPVTGAAATTPSYGFNYAIDAQPYGNSASAANPNGAATGAVTFKNGSATLGTVALASNGIAELRGATLPTGNYNITAVYPGDASFQASTSSPVALTVTPAATSLQTTASSNQVNAGDSVTITANFVNTTGKQFLDSMGAAPTGTVTFMSNSTVVGTSPVTGTAGSYSVLATGSASFTTTQLHRGGNLITATYNGDANYEASSPSSNYDYISVMGALTKMTVVPALSTIKVDQSLPVTVTLPLSGSLPIPTGTVTVTAMLPGPEIVYTAPTAQVVNGSVTVTIPASSLPLGAVTLGAVYSGDYTYSGNSATADIQVNSTGTIQPTVALTLPSAPVIPPVPVTITVSGPSGDAVPTGPVTITGTLMTWTLTNGSVTFNYGPSLAAGPNSLTATYLGDSNYMGGSATGTVTLMATSFITFAPGALTVAVNQPLALTVAVVPAANIAAPTGTITLSSGTYTSPPAQLTAGSASFTIPANSFVVGNDILMASYSGDANYTAVSNTKLVIVTPAVLNPSFTLTGTAVTVAPGATTGNTSAITVTPSGGFTGNVAMTATVTSSPAGAQYPPTLSFGSTSLVNIASTEAGTATLTISTTAPTSGALVHPKRPGAPWYAAGGATLACLLLFAIPARRRSWRTMLGMLALFVALASGVFACGGGGGGGGGSGGGGGGGGGGGIAGTTPGAYTITVTGTSGSIVATCLVNLTVQ